MTGKNMTCKELMQYMIAQNVKRTLTDMLREAGYEIGFDAGQVEIDGVEKMVERLVLSTSGMGKGCRKSMSKEHPYGYFYRTMCTVMARTNDEEVYTRDVYVAGYASKWDLSITMIWDASDRDPNYGDILWVSSEEEFDPFEDKRDKIIVMETETAEAETADVEETEAKQSETEQVETETVETAGQEQKGVYNPEYWKRISRRLKTIIADGKPAKETRKGYPYKKLVNDMLRLEATCYVKRLLKDAGYEIDMLHGAFVYPARGVVLSAYPMWDEDGFFTEFDHPSESGYEYTAKVPIQYGGAQKNVRTLIIYGEIGKYGHTVNSIMDEDSEEVVWNRFESVRNAYGIKKFDPWNGAVG